MTTQTVLLAPDAVVPFRDVLLDGSALTDHLATLVPEALDRSGLQLRRVKYRIGEGLRVVFDVAIPEGRVTLSARTFADPAKAEVVYRAALHAAVTPAGAAVPAVSYHGATQSVWWALPSDRKLAGLAAVLSPTRALSVACGVDWVRSIMAEYNPEKCLTVACVDSHDRTVAYAKAYRKGAAPALVARYNALLDNHEDRTDGALTPRAWMPAANDNLALLQPMPGLRWDQVAAADLPRSLRMLGGAVARFHRRPTKGFAPHTRLSTPHVRRCLLLIAAARPDLADRCERLDAAIMRAVPATLGRPVMLHGDLHPKNALFDGSRVCLIDLDQAGIGTPAQDIASLHAHLRYGALTGRCEDDTASMLAAQFLNGYGEAGSVPDAATLRWFTAVALIVERAARAVNRVHLDGLAVLPALLNEAHALVERPLP